jgi:hypothetical protein
VRALHAPTPAVISFPEPVCWVLCLFFVCIFLLVFTVYRFFNCFKQCFFFFFGFVGRDSLSLVHFDGLWLVGFCFLALGVVIIYIYIYINYFYF